jgi:hypothetical protein
MTSESRSKKRVPKSAKIIISIAASIAVILMIYVAMNGREDRPVYEFEDQQIPLGSYMQSETISIPGFESITIAAGETDIAAKLYNPEGNPCYFEISILLGDTAEEIYKSKLISPGQTLYEVSLNRALDKGNYDAVLHYNTFSLDDYADMNGANVPIRIMVE